MRIVHITSSISRIGAGLSKALRDLAVAQASIGNTIQIVTLLDQFTHLDQPKHDEITVSAFPITLASRFGYSRILKKKLGEYLDAADIVHMHGLWMYPNWVTGKLALKSSTPFIVSPHGMLEFWGLGRSRWKKKISGLFFEYKNLANAHCLHACSEQEVKGFFQFGYEGPVALVPIGLTRSEFDFASSRNAEHRVVCCQPIPFVDKKILLFLSRLHVKKGLEFLLDTWGLIANDFKGWHLVIAGDGEPAYVAKLLRKVRAAGQENSITFTGPVYGDDKWGLLKKARLFVLPTYSENFGLVVVEALACGVPVVTTKGAPWKELETQDCGWWVDVGAHQLADCLVDALSLSGNRLAEMGERGRCLIERKYMVDITARSMQSVYEWMLNGGDMPGCMKSD